MRKKCIILVMETLKSNSNYKLGGTIHELEKTIP